ncbi:MAG: tetratricopeptide repeat protein [bacterium]|nr:tetratricopeptide repeat protein [bacterium]
MRLGYESFQWTRRFSVVLIVAALCCAAIPAEAAKEDRTDSQLAFGIQMAKRGLWNEALFRFSRVLKERPGDVRVLNNMAVAYEAIGEFELALEHYKRALEGDSANKELRRNYAQFVEFYESLRPKTDDEPKADESADESGEGEANGNGGSRR